jgi:hypothetical protein
MRLCPTFNNIALLCLLICSAIVLAACSSPTPYAPAPLVITVPVPVTVVTTPTPPQVTVQPTVISVVMSATPTAPKVTVPVVIPPKITVVPTVPMVTVIPTMSPPKITVRPTLLPTMLPMMTPSPPIVAAAPTLSGPTRTSIPVLAPEDCLPYNPAKLNTVNEGAQGWLLTDGVSRMLMLDDQSDAQKALALAKRHTTHCFIGRDNKRSNRRDYIVEYWKGNSGQTITIASEDCIPYNRANLKIVDEGANGWLLTDGSSRMVMLDDQQDAERALTMAKGYGQQCFIGRDNQRANRKDYIVTYWK